MKTAMDESTVRNALEAERASTLARLGAMTAEYDGIVAASVDTNADDEHDPEGSTIAFERAQVAALVSQAQADLDDLDRAMARLDKGAYAICERCGSQIDGGALVGEAGHPDLHPLRSDSSQPLGHGPAHSACPESAAQIGPQLDELRAQALDFRTQCHDLIPKLGQLTRPQARRGSWSGPGRRWPLDRGWDIALRGPA